MPADSGRLFPESINPTEHREMGDPLASTSRFQVEFQFQKFVVLRRSIGLME